MPNKPPRQPSPDGHRAPPTIRVAIPYRLNSFAERLCVENPRLGFHHALLAAAESVAAAYWARRGTGDEGPTEDGHVLVRGFSFGATRLFDAYAPAPPPDGLELVWGEHGVTANQRLELVRLNVDKEGRSTAFTRRPD